MGLVFRRYAGSLQVDLNTFADLQAAADMPEALWMATACPARGLHCDDRFLEVLDADHNGRIRAEEVRLAVAFCARMFRDRSGFEKGAAELNLTALSDAAAPLRAAAELVLDQA